MKRRIFVDMDGTLAKWNNVPTDVLYEQGYYENLKPNERLVNEIKQLINDGEDIYILSSFLYDSQYALQEKKNWLDKYLPEITSDKRIFVKYGDNKNDYISGKITSSDYLIDDYTKNLLEWKAAGGTGIKYLNGINHTRGTWDGFKLRDDDGMSEKINIILNYSNENNKNFNEKYIELRSDFLYAIDNYRKSIDKTFHQFLNAEIELKDAKKAFLNERSKLLEFYKIEEKNRWVDEGNIIVHYEINFNNGQTLYEGYTSFDLTPEGLSSDKVINDVLHSDFTNSIDISKVSPEVSSFVDSILSTDHEGSVQLTESDLMSLWDLSRTGLWDKMREVEKELEQLGIRSDVDIRYTGDGYVKSVDVNSSIIFAFDYSKGNDKQEEIVKEQDEDLEMEMGY